MKIDSTRSYNAFAKAAAGKSINIKNKYKLFEPNAFNNPQGKGWIDIGSLETHLSKEETSNLRRETLRKIVLSCGCALFKGSVRNDLKTALTGVKTERILLNKTIFNTKINAIQKLASTLNKA